MGEDDVVNTVGIALTDSHGELTETLTLYCITNNTLPFMTYNIYIKCINIFTYVSMLGLYF